MRMLFLATVVLGAMAMPAGAQTGASGVVAGKVGVAAATGGAGAALGGTVTFALSDRLAVEGEGTWLDRGAASSAMSVTGALIIKLRSSGEGAVLVPYGVAGGGWYRARFDLWNERFLGPIDPAVAPGSTVCAGPGAGFGRGMGFGDCPGGGQPGYWGVNQIPAFYGRRLGSMIVPASMAWGTRTFNDPALVFGGGVEVVATPRLSLRHDARAVVVIGDSGTHVVGQFGVNVGWRF